MVYGLWLCTVQIAVYGKSFNRSARDAWELFQSTGVEAIVAYDCSGAVLLMGTIFGGLITGTCSGVWAWMKWTDRAFMIGLTSMLMGMVLVSLFKVLGCYRNFCHQKHQIFVLVNKVVIFASILQRLNYRDLFKGYNSMQSI